jgi:hypothetical protein
MACESMTKDNELVKCLSDDNFLANSIGTAERLDLAHAVEKLLEETISKRKTIEGQEEKLAERKAPLDEDIIFLDELLKKIATISLTNR